VREWPSLAIDRLTRWEMGDGLEGFIAILASLFDLDVAGVYYHLFDIALFFPCSGMPSQK